MPTWDPKAVNLEKIRKGMFPNPGRCVSPENKQTEGVLGRYTGALIKKTLVKKMSPSAGGKCDSSELMENQKMRVPSLRRAPLNALKS